VNFIDGGGAREVASQALARRLPALGDFAELQGAAAGDPVQVHTVFGEPSYWTVPVLDAGHLVGFIRLLRDGRITAAGRFGGSPPPQLVTGIPAEEAVRLARPRIHSKRGEIALDPMFVHDGPPGREAWLVPVAVGGGRITRWIFVSKGGIYERTAGELRAESRE
jgi:hypothetical protein